MWRQAAIWELADLVTGEASLQDVSILELLRTLDSKLLLRGDFDRHFQ